MAVKRTVRVRVFTHKDQNGKYCYRSFYGKTKKDAMAKAAEYKSNISNDKHKGKSVLDAVNDYVKLSMDRISPTTYKTYLGYTRTLKKYDIALIPVDQVNSVSMQSFINAFNLDHAPKTTRNIYNIVKESILLINEDFNCRVKLPKTSMQEKYIPTFDDVRSVYYQLDDVMQIALQIALECMARRGEVCALTFNDIDYDAQTVTISKSYALTVNNNYVLKSTKTVSSVRTVSISNALASRIKALNRDKGEILGIKPSMVTNRFDSAVERAGVNKFSFHALRHLGQSIASSSGIPSAYIEQRGGWSKGSQVRVQHYDHVIDIAKHKYDNLYIKKISEIL